LRPRGVATLDSHRLHGLNIEQHGDPQQETP
jgi:hypothetical protein